MYEEFIAKLRTNPKWYKEDKEKVLGILDELNSELKEAKDQVSSMELAGHDYLERISTLIAENERLQDSVDALSANLKNLEAATGVEIAAPEGTENAEPPADDAGARVFERKPIGEDDVRTCKPNNGKEFPGRASRSVLQVIDAREQEMIGKMLQLSKELDLAMLKSSDYSCVRKIVANYMPFILALRNYDSAVGDLIKMVTATPEEKPAGTAEASVEDKKEKITFAERMKKIGAWFKVEEPVDAGIESAESDTPAEDTKE